MNYLETIDPECAISYLIQDETGKLLAQRQPNKKVPSASIIKIPILLTLLEAVDKGELALDSVHVLKSQDKVGGAGELQFVPDGTELTFRFLAREMIRISDNSATNILIEQLGMNRIQDWLSIRGFTDTQLNRKMMDFDAIERGHQNYTSPTEINRILLMLVQKDKLPANSIAEALVILKSCEDNETLTAFLPTKLEVAHKTGTLDYVRGDAGIIFGRRPLILSVFVENFDDISEAEKIIAEIGKLAYETYGK
ncbi:serine hydrolase [Cyclobacterium jeungdonense]|uniref:beta-lactamase n=1 Tax=Cyclobacterium jeungdonense TaxID=708087 RepID=A0ABT8CBX7_9BACT|nr:serine hydrolase [Cyclobacterium jeungdonense]MDN3689313.1 serine hydrolase [Cyclobacterium jeungdonense]